MNNNLLVLGLSHRSASVDVRERFALQKGELEALLNVQRSAPEGIFESVIKECIVLSTCNRVEIIAYGEGDMAASLRKKWGKAKGEKAEELLAYTYEYTGKKAVEHVFTVAGSLDSMVLGEPQILGQLKEAYRFAVQAKNTGPILNRLLHKAFSVAKRVRTETGIAASAVSVSYAAVELAKRIFNNLSEHKALLIGAGEMAELAARHLLQAGINHLYISNRTFERAKALALQLRGEAISFDEIVPSLHDVDIIISSTGATEAILKAVDIAPILPKRAGRPMFFIDIAVPRDLDPDINNFDDVFVYDIDDLKDVVEENMTSRRDESQKALSIVHEEVENFEKWFYSLALQPTIVDLIQHFEHCFDTAFMEIEEKFSKDDQQLAQLLQKARHKLVRKLAHDPLTFLKKSHEPQENRHVDALRRLFNLDKDRENRR